ncbi:MAG: hypothetical protein ACSLFQ_23335 [Thermoanaerobaculia bacterium]
MSGTVLVLLSGCATNFSAPAVRAEIARQTGSEPREAFEVYAGPVTMAVVRTVLGARAGSDISLPGSRVTSFEIAVYELAPKTAAAAPRLDLTLMPVRGWEPSLRYRAEDRSGMVLIRTSGDSVADLVVLASDKDGVTYGRLRGSLSKELPGTLGRIMQDGGSDAIKDKLETMAGEK